MNTLGSSKPRNFLVICYPSNRKLHWLSSFHYIPVVFNAILICISLISWAEHVYCSVYQKRLFWEMHLFLPYKHMVQNQVGFLTRLSLWEPFFVIKNFRIREYKPHPSILVQREVSHGGCGGMFLPSAQNLAEKMTLTCGGKPGRGAGRTPPRDWSLKSAASLLFTLGDSSRKSLFCRN